MKERKKKLTTGRLLPSFRRSLLCVFPALSLRYEESEFLADFVVVEKGLQNVFSLGLIKEGLCSVQDVSAGRVVRLLDPQAGDEILDACAAPGGKFYYTASRMNYEGKLVALDASRNRMKALERGMRSFPPTLAVETYVQHFQPFLQSFSLLLLPPLFLFSL